MRLVGQGSAVKPREVPVAFELSTASKSDLAHKLATLKRQNSSLREGLTNAPAKLSLMHGAVSVGGAAAGGLVDHFLPQVLTAAHTSTLVAGAAAALGYLWDMPEMVVFGSGMIGPAVRARVDTGLTDMAASKAK